MMKNQFDPEKISLLEVRMLKMRVERPEDFDALKISGYHLDHSLEMAFSLQEKQVKADFKTLVKTQSGCAGEATGFFQLEFLYSVEKLEEFVRPERGGKPVLPTALAGLLSSITYSTSRGIFLEKLRGTVLEHFILPVIHPDKLHPFK